MGTDQRIRSAFPRSVSLDCHADAFLVAVPVLLGALLTVVTGMLADRFGGRAVFALLMIIVAVPAYVVPTVPSYRMLLYVAFFLGAGWKLVCCRNGICFLRTGAEEYVAYGQKCTHLSCAVYFSAKEDRLECPCHQGFFSVRDGSVLQGPPPRPLPQITLERDNAKLIAVGVKGS